MLGKHRSGFTRDTYFSEIDEKYSALEKAVVLSSAYLSDAEYKIMEDLTLAYIQPVMYNLLSAPETAPSEKLDYTKEIKGKHWTHIEAAQKAAISCLRSRLNPATLELLHKML